MGNYYFLANALPPLEIGSEPELSFNEFAHLLSANLSGCDLKAAMAIRHFYDLLNIRLHLLEMPLDPRGAMSEAELDEALLTEEGFADYVFAFLHKYEGKEARLRHFGELVASFFREEQYASAFVSDYFAFERELRLVLLGFRAKRMQRDIAVELQHEDPSETLVAQIVAQKDAKHYEPPYGYEELKPLFEAHQESPVELHKELCHYRFRKVAEMVEGELFSLNTILSYMVQLILVEQWQELDAQQGEEVVESIVKEVS